MAIWTRAMGQVAIIGMCIGLFSLWLIFTTFRETRRAADEARRSADAFISAERGRIQVSFRGGGIQDADEPIKLKVMVTLQGRSGVEITQLCWKNLDSLSYPKSDLAFLQRDHSRKIDAKDVGQSLVLDEIIALRSSDFVGGWVEYDTAFMHGARTYFVGEIVQAAVYGDGRPGFNLKLQRHESWPRNT